MFESEGYCPYNMFARFEGNDRTNEVRRRLGERTGWMVYTPNGFKDEALAVPALLDGISELGLQVADKLENLIPICVYSEIGKKILLTDLQSKQEIPANAECFEDDRYCIAIKEDSDVVYMYIVRL